MTTGMELCGECGVPLMVSKRLRWESSGVISLAGSPRDRIVFNESANIDDLFRGIEELIKRPIEHIVIETRRRETRRYLERSYPSEIKELLAISGDCSADEDPSSRSARRKKMLEMRKESNIQLNELGRIYGYGDITLSDRWELEDEYAWRTQIVRNPYSLLFYAADMLGSVEAFEETDMRVGYEETGDNKYTVTACPGSYPVGLKKRLGRKRYDIRPGDIRFRRCPQCGIPMDVARCRWELEDGTITDPDTGRRMALFGPASLDAIFDDLEAEMGEVIPEMVIEAQRRYMKSAMREENWRRGAPDFRHIIALAGLGNLTSFEGHGEQFTITIENSCLHLAMVGTLQALYELAMNKESSACEWSLAEDGVLTMTVSGR